MTAHSREKSGKLQEDCDSKPAASFLFLHCYYMEPIAELAYSVTPANPGSESGTGAGVQNILTKLDSGFHRNDIEGRLQLALLTI